MNVLELYHLAAWYKADFKQLRRQYSELHQALAHNASQPNKQPIEPLLDPLLAYLREINLGELSIQELGLLDHLKVRELLGPEGADYLESIVRAADYDPATTERNVNAAIQAISQANEWLTAYYTAVEQLGIHEGQIEDEEAGYITVRIGFKNDASIRNVKDWKSSADDWYQIVRGLALLCGEAPEDTRVVGASTGSIILILSATYAFSKILATISKHITGIAKDVIDVRMALEDLRTKKLLNATIEEQFKAMEQQKRDDGLAAIRKELAEMLPKAPNGEQSTALEKSIAKLVAFGEEGGDIDFVAPEPSADGAADESSGSAADTGTVQQIQNIRNIILTYQEQREAVRLLSDQTKAKGGDTA